VRGHTSVVTLNSRRASLSHVAVIGKGNVGDTFGATQNAIVLGSNCTECLLFDLYVNYGASAISVAAADAVIMDVYAAYAYGSAIEVNTGPGTWHIRTKYDQSTSPTTSAATRRRSSSMPAHATTTTWSTTSFAGWPSTMAGAAIIRP